MRNKVFISYSHADRRSLDQLQVFLKPIERQGIIDRWDDTKLKAGQQWRDEIESALESAKVAVLLVSANFLASDFISNQELPSLLAAAEREGATILSVIVSPCDLPPSLSQFQAVNDPKKTLIDMKKGERDRVWMSVVKSIEGAIAEVASGQNTEDKVAQPAGNKPAPVQQPARQEQEQPLRPGKLSVAEELDLEGVKAGDIAGVKGEDPARLIDRGTNLEVAKKTRIKNSELGDLVGIKQERREPKDDS